MGKIIIGNTGVVGKTLCEKIKFDLFFNTSNIDTYKDYVKDGDDLFLSCLPAQKWLINKDVIKDFKNIMDIINNISNINYNNIVLISTIDVYLDSPINVDESYNIDISKLHYGTNRYLFELLVKELKYKNLKIFRLPGLFNKHIKKNVIFDLLNNKNIESLNKNSAYQWYNLDNIHKDIENLSNNFPNETLFNIFTEPIETSEILSLFNMEDFGIIGERMEYNFFTKYSKNNYLYDKKTILNEIKELKNELMC